jgi:hypothetical protein
MLGVIFSKIFHCFYFFFNEISLTKIGFFDGVLVVIIKFNPTQDSSKWLGGNKVESRILRLGSRVFGWMFGSVIISVSGYILKICFI